jgi:hypothetical protein
MAVIEGGASAVVAEVGAAAQKALHVTQKPIPYGSLGHYRAIARFGLVATQAAGSRLFEMRNGGSNILIITKLDIRWLQTAAHTAAIEDSLDVFRNTSFSAVDTTNTVTPTATVKQTAGMSVAPGGAVLRQVTVAGAAAGMTGGTRTPDAAPFAQLPKWLLAAVPTASEVKADLLNAMDDYAPTHPLVLAANEGIEVQNRVLLGAAAGSSVYVDIEWCEATAF